MFILLQKKKEDDKDPCGIIPLENLLVRSVDIKSHKNIFELYSQNGEIKSCKLENGQLVKGHHGSYLVSVVDKATLESWISAIRKQHCIQSFVRNYQETYGNKDCKEGRIC